MDLEPLWRVLLAAGLSLPVGLERELRGKAAGLRTHVLVSIGSAALGYVSILAAPEGAASDQTRIAAQVVSGIGFMGAGIIFAAGGRVHGLTTAAALWTSMAIGLCAGLGAAWLAAALTVVALLFLWPMDVLAARIVTHVGVQERTLSIIAADLEGVATAQRLLTEQVPYREMGVESFGSGLILTVQVRCAWPQAADLRRRLDELPQVAYVSNAGLIGDQD